MKTNSIYFSSLSVNNKILRLVFLILFTLSSFAFAQITVDGTTGDYTTNIDNVLTHVDKSPITTGILYDRVMSFADLDILREDGTITTSNYQHFMQSWSELYRASYSPSFLSLDNLKNNLSNTSIMMTPMAIGNPNPPINQSNTVYLGIINTKMNYIDFGTPTQQSLDYNNGYLYNKPGINPILEKQVTVIAPLKEKITTNTATFKLSPSYILQLTGSPIKNLIADFGTGTTYNLITNGVNSTTYPSVTFSSSGKKTFTFNVTYNDNSTELLKATMDVQLSTVPVEYNKITGGIYPEAEDFVGTSGITQTIAFKGYNETTATSGKLEYRTYYNTVTNPGFDPANRTFSIQPKLRKEVIILDGYDPGDGRKIYPQSTGYTQEHSSIFELMQYDPDDNPQTNNNKNLIRVLQDKGYDVTLVNFQNGADYIERNAMALVALLQRENAKLASNGSSEQIAIIGPSMGGLVSRYALAYMEKNNIQHNTRLWVSFDSPHLGANIPIAAQETLYFFGYKANQDVAKTKFDENFRSPAARQMLIEQIDYAHQNPPYTTDLLPNGAVPSGQNDNTPFRYQFLNNLNNNGISGSSGFPQNLRKIAVINGNTLGVKTNNESQLHLELAAFKIVKYGQIFGTSIQTKINVARIEDRFLSIPYNNVQTFYGKSTSFGFLYVNFLYHTVNRSNPNPRGSMDVVPGGLYNTQGIIKEEFDAALNEAIPGRRSIEWRTYVPNHAFIPTVSSLAFKNPNFNWNTPLNRNLICDTNNKEIPFDSYFAPAKNEEHVFVSGNMVNWLMKELDGQPQLPTFPIEASQFTGSNLICPNSTNTYSFADICKIPGNVTWSLSNNNVQILSTTSTSITLKGITSGTTTLTANFNNGQTLSKDITVFTLTTLPTPSGTFQIDEEISCYDDGAKPITFIPDTPFYGTITISPSILPHPLRSQTRNITVKYTNPCTGAYISKVITFNYEAPYCPEYKQPNNSLYTIYPNPTKDILNISLVDEENKPSSTSNASIELYNSLGIIQSQATLKNNKATISINSLLQGVYTLKIYYDQTVESHQIIKN